MALIDSYLTELDHEAQTTRRVLERVPATKLEWAPHKRSMTLGHLSLHIAQLPGAIAYMATQPMYQRPNFVQNAATSVTELIPTLDQSLAKAHECLQGMDDAQLMSTWRLLDGEREMLSVPVGVLLRNLMLNHWYHHRGQLSVYLRELEVPVPSIYGPSADENPFAV